MEPRNRVVIRQPLPLNREAVSTGFQQEHTLACFGQPRREGPAAGSRTDDDIVPARLPGVIHGGAQKVFRKLIRACLSSSLNSGSLPKDCSSLLSPSWSLNCAVPK